MSLTEDISEAGYTLLELLVVLVVAGLLVGSVAIALPERSATVGEASAQLSIQLRSERSRAMIEGKTFDVVVSVPERKYLVNNQWFDFPEGVEVRAKMGQELGNASNSILRFFPDGTSSGGEIGLKTDNESATLAINWMTGSIVLGNP